MRVESTNGTSSDVEILAIFAPHIIVSTDSPTTWLFEDDQGWHKFHNVPVCGLPGDKSEEREFPDLLPILKRTKKKYN